MAHRSSKLKDFSALAGVAARELTWTIPQVERELARWRRKAGAIPDPVLRADALARLRAEHMNAAGAALFAAIPPSRSIALLRGLVAYQVALDFLDAVTEPPRRVDQAVGHDLHRALLDAVDLAREPTDYYIRFPGPGDAGYLASLVATCRAACLVLPGFAKVRLFLRRAASDLSVQVLNHIAVEADRNRALGAWAASRADVSTNLPWFELAAASSSTLGIYALLAAAVDPHLRCGEAKAIDAAYHPWICLACTLMDSLVDELDDRASGAHSYVAHYDDDSVMAVRVRSVVQRAISEAGYLPRGDRHVVIVTGMIAMYLAAAKQPHPEIRWELGWLAAVEMPVTRAMRALLGGNVRWRISAVPR